MTAAPDTANRTAARGAWLRKPGILPVLVLLLGVAVTWGATSRMRSVEDHEVIALAQMRMNGLADKLADRARRFKKTGDVLAQLIGVSDTLTNVQWQQLINTLGVQEYPAVQAVSYVTLEPGGVPGRVLLANVRYGAANTASQRLDPNGNRRLAAVIERALENGQTDISPLVPCGETNCALQVSMVYRTGLVPATAAERRAHAKGLVLLEISPARGIRNVAREMLPGDHLNIALGAPGEVLGEALNHGSAAEPLLEQRVQVPVGGRYWQVSVACSAQSCGVTDRSRSNLTLVLGLCITALLGMLSAYQASMRRRVERRAREMTNALRLSEERYRHISDMSSDWYWEQDADYRFTHISSGIRQHGWEPEDFIGRTRWEVAGNWSAQEIAEHKALLDRHAAIRRYEYGVIDSTGTGRRYMISADPLWDDQGRFVGYRGIGEDVTEARRLAKELHDSRDSLKREVAAQTADLRVAKEAAEAANLAKSEFVANISHELRTPLHAIMSFANIGEKKAFEAPPDKLKSYFEKVHAAGDRLLKLINDLLDLSKLEAGHMVVKPVPVDLLHLLTDVAEEFQSLLTQNGLSVELPPSEPWLLPLDAGRMTQVLRNLCANAIKFSPPGGMIRVTLQRETRVIGRRAGDSPLPVVVLTIMDRGMGIPENELESVFDKFVQSSKTKTGAGGTGLGLSICREIVDAHHGRIRAYNRSGGGAAFEVVLPSEPPAEPPI